MTPQPLRCLLTGASGFIGLALLPHLQRLGYEIVAWPRTELFDLANENPLAANEWRKFLHGVDVVIHLAGLAHQPRSSQDNDRFFRLNRDGTLKLASAASTAGVKRFIFISSAKVFGEGGPIIYDDATMPQPADAYALSKWEAEQQLVAQFATAMEIVILRPPLVYGLHARANFGHLLALARLPIPLPFAAINNQRAMIGIDNLVDLIAACVSSPAAAGHTFLCADKQHYSLADIVSSIRLAFDRKPFLFRMPPSMQEGLIKLTGKELSQRLFGDFHMDCSTTAETLGWEAPLTMSQLLRNELQGAGK